MKPIILLILSFILLTNCNKIPTCENCNFTCIDTNETDILTNNCKTDWECNYKTFSNSTILINEFNGYTKGDKTVFQMFSETEGSPMIADDELTNIMVFEIDNSLTSFSIEDNELSKIKLHYRKYCYCINIDFVPITKGCIQGEKQSNGSWFIQANFIVEYSGGDNEVKIEANFK